MENPHSAIRNPQSSHRVDYYPLIAIFSFWLTSAFLPSLIVIRPYVTILGVVTIPALVCIFLAALAIRRKHKQGS
jgi:hypothetical protein